MKKNLFLLLFSALLFSDLSLMAQSPWLVGGNATGAVRRFGSTTSFGVQFITDNQERGIMTANGLWGFGTLTPNARVNINSEVGQNPFRIDVNNLPKFLVHNNGGVAIGGNLVPPVNGLHVNGLVGVGTSNPAVKLHVTEGTDVNLAGGGFIVAGSLTSINLALDNNEILARNNGARADLFLNQNGGNLIFNGTNGSGNMGIGNTQPASRLHITGGTDAAQGGGGFIIAGGLSGENIAIDNNEIMARTNGVASPLFLNHNGGNVILQAGPNSTAGKLGIHTDNPIVEAHLVHGVGTGANHGLRLANSGRNNQNWTIYVSNSNGNLDLYANNAFLGRFNDATGAYSTVSDLKFKKDIEKADAVMPKVLQLDVKKYHFLKNKAEDKKNYGLIAQEVEKIFPEVVFLEKGDDGSETYTMDYSAFGVLAIKAIQELQQTVTAQQQQNLLLQKQISTFQERFAQLEAALKSGGNFNLNNSDLLGVSLEQNRPNPVNEMTTFRYTIPAGTIAQIQLFEVASGKLIKTLAAPETGQVQLNGSELQAGTYIYTLVVNGRLVAAKQLLLSK
ncbi:tail fiber domain-containing protein [Adhaeribacter radiodurans]|uniref:Tail fiber domain-containing protein n=1 Tax=Adhaeribacter radiodurans TaxID=2745197 RepID=A0A7L7L980_9BACT|nr:tail fiber domain-containing protein [Adhaeribacter radiodurans]QMU29065.1 tail fiber domain-containing protein [Adhaeribacter radiodurans]